MINKALITKYNVPGPRYTSYPTVPFWKNNPLDSNDWFQTIYKNLNHFKSNEISIYVHLPFCESLCTFCGCHKHITKNHSHEIPYLEALLIEWEMYKKVLPADVKITELHLGGGTPTFFSAENLEKFLTTLLNTTSIDPNACELSFEAHPMNTTSEHLQVLYNIGFRRLSLGVQSYGTKVQEAIHRFQPYSKVKEVHQNAKNIGYTSISHDLVYGLPKQSWVDMLETVLKTIDLLPDRISLYSYAHVPWIKGTGQRGFDESDLPKDSEKRALYDQAKQLLLTAGYLEIGMDHFALPSDELYKAFKNKTLHRNFMGYTTKSTNTMIGLGMSAISDSWFGFAQNEKSLSDYLIQIEKGQLPVFRGHLLSDIELVIRQHILDLMCHFETKLHFEYSEMNEGIIDRLQPMIDDELVFIKGNKVKVAENGIPFIRNCCMAFDLDLLKSEESSQRFSQTV